MLFNSVHFLLFFPIVVLCYFLLPHRYRWIWLLVASYYFYMSWNPVYALLIATSTVITYTSGLCIHKANKLKDEKKRTQLKKSWVFLSFVSNLLILFFFKYGNFALETVEHFLIAIGLTVQIPNVDILLPVGISFYTFQALSYTMDVYRGDVKAEPNIGKYALFVSFFPQLVAGPIERSKDLLEQIHQKHTFCYTRVRSGLGLMLWGFFQKLVIADRIAILVNEVYGNYKTYGGAELVLATVLFAIQIYCDFSGYSDIAIGAAEVMGFKLMQNFKRPYFARTIPEFWKRWHISLSSWFKDYLYIPLGGNRCSKAKHYRNIMVVFVMSGIWHGVGWHYAIWGILHGSYQIIGDQIRPLKARVAKMLRLTQVPRVYALLDTLGTFILVSFAWIFFRAPSGKDAVGIISQIASGFDRRLFTSNEIYDLGLGQKDFQVMLLGIGVLFIVNLLQEKIKVRQLIFRFRLPIRWGIYLVALFSILIFGVYGPGYAASQFIYFQF